MISVIVSAAHDPAVLARLLTALTPGAAEGLIREVAVLGADGACRNVADDAGADLYPAGGFAQAFERAKGPWIAGLPLAARLAPHWVETLGAYVGREPAQAARLVSQAWWRIGEREGWLAPKSLALLAAVGAREQHFQRLARRSGRRLRILLRR